MDTLGVTGERPKIRLAPAKLNLTLDVLGRRPDGYHEIRSAMVPVSLFDRLEASPRDDLSVENPAVESREDLVLTAARRLREASGTHGGAHIKVTKDIPTGAGLGGGSSDAAATLLLLNDLWQTGADASDLARVGAELGSDIPFFLFGRPAVVGGRGEEIVDTFPAPDLTLVVLKPPEGLDTALVYSHCRTGGGHRTERFLDALRAGAVDLAGNDLEEAARRLLPSLDGLFAAALPHAAHLTGSGSALFVAFADASQAEAFRAKFPPPVFARSVRPLEEMPSGRANASTGRA